MTASEKLRALDEAATPGPWEHISTTVVSYPVDILVSGDCHVAKQIRRSDAALIAGLRDALPLIADCIEAAEEVGAAHQAVIEGVTPGHENWCADDRERYDARFSQWHAASRNARASLAALREHLEGQ